MQGLGKTLNLYKQAHRIVCKKAVDLCGKNNSLLSKQTFHTSYQKKLVWSSLLKYSTGLVRNQCFMMGRHANFTVCQKRTHAKLSNSMQNPNREDLTSSKLSHEEINEAYSHENLVNSGWLIKLANENGYLSWCRNTYLTTVVGAAMFVQATVPYAKEAAEVLLIIGGLNLTLGTGSFVYNLIACRRRTQMHRLTVVVYIALAMFHLLLWVFGVALYFLGHEAEEELINELHHPQDV